MLEVLVGLLAAACGWLLVMDWRRRSYWSRRGVPQEGGVPLLGSSLPVVLGRRTRTEVLRRLYGDHASRWVGLYEGARPCLLVRDPALATCLLEANMGREGGGCGLLGEVGPRWAALRQALAPLLSERLLTDAIPLIKSSTKILHPEDPSSVSIVPLCSSFTVDFVGAWAFNQDLNPDESFPNQALALLEPSSNRLLASLRHCLGLRHPRPEVGYFTRLFTDNVTHRKENNTVRDDLLQLLASLKEKGFLEVPPQKGKTEKTDKIEVTDELLAMQAVSAVSPGCDALTLGLVYTLLELAAHPDHQEAARKEILNLGPHLTLATLAKATFLSNCIKEVVRLHPVVGEVSLEIKEEALTEELVLRPGTRVVLSLAGLFSDPHLFPQPQEFDPHRFEKPLPPGAFIPFGHGPRACIGEGLTEVVLKAACWEVLTNYRLTVSASTLLPLPRPALGRHNWPSVPVVLHFTRIPSS